MIGVACLMGTQQTSDWATDDFLASQILQALGQSFALTALLVLAVGTDQSDRLADDRPRFCRRAGCSGVRSARRS